MQRRSLDLDQTHWSDEEAERFAHTNRPVPWMYIAVLDESAFVPQIRTVFVVSIRVRSNNHLHDNSKLYATMR